jgi:hypothetical protein
MIGRICFWCGIIEKLHLILTYNLEIYLFPTCDHKKNVLKNCLLYVHNHVIFTYNYELNNKCFILRYCLITNCGRSKWLWEPILSTWIHGPSNWALLSLMGYPIHIWTTQSHFRFGSFFWVALLFNLYTLTSSVVLPFAIKFCWW